MDYGGCSMEGRLCSCCVLVFVLTACSLLSCGPRREIVERVPVYASDEERQLEESREKITDSTKWGKGEVRPWEERYDGNNPSRPYQGPANPSDLKKDEDPKFEVD